jgi:ABC transport system ATP-binding/permease protein
LSRLRALAPEGDSVVYQDRVIHVASWAAKFLFTSEQLKILEESLLEFCGSIVLVTNDRCLLDRVSTAVLGLDGQSGAESFADYAQWESWQADVTAPLIAMRPDRLASDGYTDVHRTVFEGSPEHPCF